MNNNFFHKIYANYEYAENTENKTTDTKSADTSKSTETTNSTPIDVTTVTEKEINTIVENVQTSIITVVNEVVNKHSVIVKNENSLSFRGRDWTNVKDTITINQENNAAVLVNSSFTGDLSSQVEKTSTKSLYENVMKLMGDEKKEKLEAKYQTDPDAQKDATAETETAETENSTKTEATEETKNSEKKDKFTNSYCSCNTKNYMFLKENATNTTTTEEEKNNVTMETKQYQHIYNKISSFVKQSSYNTVINQCLVNVKQQNKISIEDVTIAPADKSKVSEEEILKMKQISGTEAYSQTNTLALISNCAADTKITVNILSKITSEFNISTSASTDQNTQQGNENKNDQNNNKDTNKNNNSNDNKNKNNSEEKSLFENNKTLIIGSIILIIALIIIIGVIIKIKNN